MCSADSRKECKKKCLMKKCKMLWNCICNYAFVILHPCCKCFSSRTKKSSDLWEGNFKLKVDHLAGRNHRLVQPSCSTAGPNLPCKYKSNLFLKPSSNVDSSLPGNLFLCLAAPLIRKPSVIFILIFSCTLNEWHLSVNKKNACCFYSHFQSGLL